MVPPSPQKVDYIHTSSQVDSYSFVPWDQDGSVTYASLLNLLASSDTFSPVVAVYLMEEGDVFQLDVVMSLVNRDGPREGKKWVWICMMVLMVRESDVMSLRELRKLVGWFLWRDIGYPR